MCPTQENTTHCLPAVKASLALTPLLTSPPFLPIIMTIPLTYILVKSLLLTSLLTLYSTVFRHHCLGQSVPYNYVRKIVFIKETKKKNVILILVSLSTRGSEYRGCLNTYYVKKNSFHSKSIKFCFLKFKQAKWL